MALVLAAPSAFAQTAPAAADSSDALREIVVTVQKREQNLSDLGMAITAVRGEELAQRGITDVAELGSRVTRVTTRSATRT
jgi:iron complex outermembrane recepter protein